MRGVDRDATHPSSEGWSGEVDRLVSGLERLRPELGPLAEELIALLRGADPAQEGAEGTEESD